VCRALPAEALDIAQRLTDPVTKQIVLAIAEKYRKVTSS
jgi:hypothetical protein